MFNLESVAGSVDNILIWGSTREEHDRRLTAVLEVALRNNIKFNRSKSKIAQKRIKYMGN